MNEQRNKRLIWLLGAVVLFFVASAVVQWLWNCIIPWVIGFPPVTYWQAAGLLLLTRLLFGRIVWPQGCRCGCSVKSNADKEPDPAPMTPGEKGTWNKRRQGLS